MAMFISSECFAGQPSETIVPSAVNYQPLNLSPKLQYLEDAAGGYAIENLLLSSARWEQSDSNISFGYTDKTYWFRTRLKNGFKINQVYYVELAYSVIDQVDFYEIKGGNVQQFIQTGDIRPYSNRAIQHRNFVFPLTLQANETVDIYFRIHTNTSLQMPVLLWGEHAYLARETQVALSQGLFYGILLVMAAYNFSIFIAVRDKAYLYYILYVLGFSGFQLSLDGFGLQYFWQDQVWLNQHAICFFLNFTLASADAFVIRFLNIRDFHQRLYKWIKAIMVVAIVMTVLSLVSPYRWVIQFTFFSMIITVITFFYAGIFGWRRGIVQARYFTIAWVALFLGSLTIVLNKNGLISRTFLTEYGVQIGGAIEVILISLALGHRISAEKNAKRLAQREALQNLEEYRALYDTAIQGIFQTSKGALISANSSFYNMFGYTSKSEFAAGAGNKVAEWFPEDAGLKLMSKLQSESGINDYESQVKTSDGSLLWVSVTARIRYTKEGESVYEGSLVDISERKMKEQAKNEKRNAERLRYEAEKNREISEDKNKAKTQFFASMSHEFRTPLTAILGYTEIAGGTDVNDQDRIGYVKTIGSSAQHMLQLINDVLDLSKIEAQKIEVELIPIDIATLIQEVHDFIWILANQRNISFEIDCQFPLPSSFTSDPTRLKQALINLCSNSVKFTHEGTVTLHISCDKSNEQVIFDIEDTGIGLKPEQLETLFEAFTQADTSISRNFGGTGLGLHLSKLIANQLGGDISVVSEYDHGSTFTINVASGSLEGITWIDQLEIGNKIDSQSIARDATPELVEGNIDSPKEMLQVMLAEDNQVNQQLIGFIIKKAGAEVVIANDGLDVIAHGLLQKFDLILMDMDMPYMDGLTATRYLRMKNIKSKIYALTGNISEESIRECLDSGCDGHLAKPLDINKLTTVIQSLTRSST